MENQYQPITQEIIDSWLPAVISDLKHHDTPEKRELTDNNIKRDLYRNVILGLSDRKNFLRLEKLDDGSSREGMYIKGYVRDVWDYLQDAYDLIHNQTYVR